MLVKFCFVKGDVVKGHKQNSVEKIFQESKRWGAKNCFLITAVNGVKLVGEKLKGI